MKKIKVKIGIIGGSGLEDPKLLKNFKEKEVKTPFGSPSSKLVFGNLKGKEVVIIARHGKDHSIMPSRVPFRANIWALKKSGCTHILATTACGSLREKIKPEEIIFPDQFIDQTNHRALTFFEDKVIHTAMADPFCPNLRKILIESAKQLKLSFHPKGTIITIEGPRFSTRAESHMFRSFGADVINMSTVPEVILAREIGICYQTIAMATDYDCWKEGEEAVTWKMILRRMKQNADNVKELLIHVVPKINFIKCGCRTDN